MKVCKAEHGLTIPLPDDVAQKLGIGEGDEVAIVPMTKPAALSRPQTDELFAAIKNLRGRAPAEYKHKRADGYEDGEY